VSHGAESRPLRVALVGFGTVGQWLARAVVAGSQALEERHGAAFSFVGIGNARDGYVHHADGLDLAGALELVHEAAPLTELGGKHWPTAAAGLRATEADVLIEATASGAETGQPGLTHIREALERGVAVVTSNKWPVALTGVELAALADARGIAFRAESTVMSGTPVLSTLREGFAGSVPIGVRGVLNATANYILSEIASGRSYAAALAEAQRIGLAERDPSADVDGHDSVAKLMILSALVFGRQLRVDQVHRRGISSLTDEELARARAGSIREVATLEFAEPGGGGVATARVAPTVVEDDDRLASATGTGNALVCRADPIGELTILGPGAGTELAGQGVLSDLLAVARSR
jgi:homoserine dehydrogenase